MPSRGFLKLYHTNTDPPTSSKSLPISREKISVPKEATTESNFLIVSLPKRVNGADLAAPFHLMLNPFDRYQTGFKLQPGTIINYFYTRQIVNAEPTEALGLAYDYSPLPTPLPPTVITRNSCPQMPGQESAPTNRHSLRGHHQTRTRP